MVSKTRHGACGTCRLMEKAGNNGRITEKCKITMAVNATKEKDDTGRVYKRGTDLARKVRGFHEEVMVKLIPKGRRDVRGVSGMGTDTRSISATQNQAYVRLRALYEMKLETDGTRPHRLSRPREDFCSLSKEW